MSKIIEEVKSELRLSADDEKTISDLTGIIERGKAYIERLTGTTLDFEENNVPKTLLLNYCRYSWNNALEYFQENFQNEILTLQFYEGIKAREKKKNEK